MSCVAKGTTGISLILVRFSRLLTNFLSMTVSSSMMTLPLASSRCHRGERGLSTQDRHSRAIALIEPCDTASR